MLVWLWLHQPLSQKWCHPNIDKWLWVFIDRYFMPSGQVSMSLLSQALQSLLQPFLTHLGIYPSFHTDTPNLILIICQTKRLEWEVWIAMSNNQKKFGYHLLEENQFRLWTIMLNCKAKEQERIWEEGIYTLLSVFL